MSRSVDGQLTLSVVIPLYNEEDVLPLLYERLSRAIDQLDSCEIIFVNDGSSDRTLELVRDLVARDRRVVGLNLSRNFGHQAALTAGIEVARGRAVVLMDGDLQDPPELISELLRAWREGYQVVVARRRSRRDSGVRGVLFRLFHRTFSLISDFPIQPDGGIFGLLDRQAANELIRLEERSRFLPGLRDWIGFRQTVVWYDRAGRAAGEPKQTLRRLFRYAFDAIFAFSYKPLRLIWMLGLAVSSFSFGYAILLLVLRLLQINVVTGFTTPTVAILFLGGLQLVLLGVIGEYLSRIYDEVKRRPPYIIAERIEQRTTAEELASYDSLPR